MSKLEELIQELCPDGVETKKLKDFLVIKNGSDYKSFGAGDYPVYGSGGIMTYIDRYAYDKPSVLIPRKGSIDKLYYVEKPFWNVDTIFYTEIDTTKAIPRYVYYCLQQKHLEEYNTAGGVPSLTQKVLNNIEILIPPLGIQREIVRILDNFTELTVELTAELTARQKQYAFYRNKLLTFGKTEGARIEKIPLGDIGSICMCKRILKSQTNTVGGVPFYKIGTFGKKADSYISQETFDEYRLKYNFPKKGDVLISAAGTIGRTVVYDGEPAYFQDSNIVWIDNDESVVLNSYLRYCYELKPWKVSSGGTIQRLYNDNIAKAVITVPPLDVQNRIVNVLDNFEKICSDLNIGLPAEIEARQKQYEYYRDKLLTFAETGNTILSRAEQSRAEQSRAEQSRAEQSRAEQSRALIKLLQYVFGYAVVTLEDIAENCDSMRKPVTSGKREAGEYPYYGASGIVDYVKGYIFDGDYLLVSEDGANLLARSTPIAFSISGKNWVNNHAHVLKFDCYETRRFVEFYLNSIDLAPYISGGAQPKLNQKNLNRIEIPLPSQERQKYIVDILDRFDSICNDLTSGLPAEIEARQKQYEYYRDKLLTFKEVAAT